MKLPIQHTELLLEEIQTDGHSPLKFDCDDGAIYYCKYLVSVDRKELNCLFYELVAQRILTHLQLPTPEVSLIKITEGTLDKSKIKANNRLKVGNVCFGSKEVSFANEFQSI
jgi:hypothetical protein